MPALRLRAVAACGRSEAEGRPWFRGGWRAGRAIQGGFGAKNAQVGFLLRTGPGGPTAA